MNSAKPAARRLEYYKNKDSKRHSVHHVLSDLCEQNYSEDLIHNDEDSEESYLSIFSLHLESNHKRLIEF